MRATAYAGLVGDARIANLVFFDYFTNTEDRLLHGVENIAEEMADLKPSLLAPVTVAQPIARLSGPGAGSLRARAWSEEVTGSNTICVHLIVLNTLNIFQIVNATITGMSRHATAVLPFEGDADRKVQVANGILNDAIAPNTVNVYRIGCTVAAPPTENISPNPSFETPSLLGGVAGWSGGRAGWANSDGHDTRARMFLDTTRPQHGRYALRITIPSKEPLVQPWCESLPSFDVLQGYSPDYAVAKGSSAFVGFIPHYLALSRLLLLLNAGRKRALQSAMRAVLACKWQSTLLISYRSGREAKVIRERCISKYSQATGSKILRRRQLFTRWEHMSRIRRWSQAPRLRPGNTFLPL
eukprot:COSAG02_NODE_183_length_30560_cov_8.912695_25_plen_355_part_00